MSNKCQKLIILPKKLHESILLLQQITENLDVTKLHLILLNALLLIDFFLIRYLVFMYLFSLDCINKMFSSTFTWRIFTFTFSLSVPKRVDPKLWYECLQNLIPEWWNLKTTSRFFLTEIKKDSISSYVWVWRMARINILKPIQNRHKQLARIPSKNNT